MSEQKASEYFHGQCARLLYGECTTRRCLVRGGYPGKGRPDFSVATCEAKEAFDAFARNEALEARLAEARAIVEDCAQWMEAVLATFAKGGATEDPGEEHLAEQIAKTRAWLENEE